jgi:hypothetical protein
MKTNFILRQGAKGVIFFVFVVPIIIQLILINIVPNVYDVRMYYLLFFIFGLLYLPYFYWLKNAAFFLHSYSNNYEKMKFARFQISLLINILTVFNFVFFTAYIFSFYFRGGTPNIDIISILIFIQFIGVFSFAYNSYYICKVISTVDLRRKVHFNEIAGKFILFAIPPLAIWILQNKVQGLLKNSSSKI